MVRRDSIIIIVVVVVHTDIIVHFLWEGGGVKVEKRLPFADLFFTFAAAAARGAKNCNHKEGLHVRLH